MGTQCRQLRAAALLMGVAATASHRTREAIAAVLSVGVLVLRELSRATVTAPSVERCARSCGGYAAVRAARCNCWSAVT
ncbi:MAG: hypothetical protein IPM29_32885 [Planctomycetes bacterium]|nr:hypothetical protein [Planctomycetota bacterium]